jgi:hypothetical protein
MNNDSWIKPTSGIEVMNRGSSINPATGCSKIAWPNGIWLKKIHWKEKLTVVVGRDAWISANNLVVTSYLI